MTAPWHLDQDLAGRYADGALGSVLTASVEQHLMSCGNCRALLDPHVDRVRLDAVWEAVVERVERPRPTLVERLLQRLGMHESTARLVAATPSLRGAWIAAMTVVLALALVAAYGSADGVVFYLTVAPLLPVAGVAMAYGRESDPAYEMAAATPYSQLRLLALRTAVVVSATLVPAAVAGVLLPGAPILALAWLLPALSLTAGTVVLSTRVRPQLAAAGLAAAWAGLSMRGLLDRHDALVAVSAPVLTVCAVALVAAALILVVLRRDLAELIRKVS
jgi:Putative zinc-finger